MCIRVSVYMYKSGYLLRYTGVDMVLADSPSSVKGVKLASLCEREGQSTSTFPSYTELEKHTGYPVGNVSSLQQLSRNLSFLLHRNLTDMDLLLINSLILVWSSTIMQMDTHMPAAGSVLFKDIEAELWRSHAYLMNIKIKPFKLVLLVHALFFHFSN